ncbi:MAG: Hint domain-containing protein [Pseudomonadota bacterium]
MANGGDIAGFLFEDFSFENDNGLLNPGQNGPFSLPGNATATLDANATQVPFTVIDDDMLFEDGFQESEGLSPTSQGLAEDINTTNAEGDPVSFAAGQVLEVEFTLDAVPVGGGPTIQLLFVAIGPGENAGDLFLVVPTAPLVPGTTYDISFANDGGGTPYEDVICFTTGTKIETVDGLRAVETIRVGDQVMLHGGGVDKIIWAGSQTLSPETLKRSPRLRPVLIEANAFGSGLPVRDLIVSPQHRVLLTGERAILYFDAPEVLAPAIALCNGSSVRQLSADHSVTYHHIMCANHQILLSEGLPTESFYPGKTALNGLDGSVRDELMEIISDASIRQSAATARKVLKTFEAALLSP